MTYEPQEERIARVIARVLGRPQDVVAEDAQAVEARADLRKDLHLDRAVGKRYEVHGGVTSFMAAGSCGSSGAAAAVNGIREPARRPSCDSQTRCLQVENLPYHLEGGLGIARPLFVTALSSRSA